MKPSYYIALLCLLLISFMSCNRQQRDQVSLHVMTDGKVRAELQEAAEVVNQSCPIQADDRTQLIGASFSDNKWTYHYIVDEDTLVRFDNDALNIPIHAGLKQSTQQHILKSPDMLTMLRALIKINADLVYDYRGKTSGKSISIVFTFAELRVMVDLMSYNNKNNPQ